MQYHTLFLSKIGKDVANLSSVAVVIGALRVKYFFSNISFDIFKELSVVIFSVHQVDIGSKEVPYYIYNNCAFNLTKCCRLLS